MVEYGNYSNDLFELDVTNWEWKKLNPKSKIPGNLLPSPRLGHTFSLLDHRVFLFGGLENESKDPKDNIPKYLNDLYILESQGDDLYWSNPQTYGPSPSPRESHSCVAYKNKDGTNPRLFIYGGMSGVRLGDLWILCVENMNWIRPNVTGSIPLPRSLHTATVIKHRMFVFGGWVPLPADADVKSGGGNTEWKCSNTLGCLNMENLCWEPLALELFEDNTPRARAGHSACEINNR